MARDDAVAGTLTVGGEGTLRVEPDVARIHLCVEAEARTAREALAEVARRTGRIVERARALGIPEGDAQTVGLELHPRPAQGKRKEEGRTAGWRAVDTVVVVASVGLAGQVLDEGLQAGAEPTSSIRFELRDEGAWRDEALRAAIEAAKQDASVVAEAMGIVLGTPHEIQVLDRETVSARGFVRELVAAPPPPVAPGHLTVSARVRLVYRYRME